MSKNFKQFPIKKLNVFFYFENNSFLIIYFYFQISIRNQEKLAQI